MSEVKGLLLVKGDRGLLEVAVYLPENWKGITNNDFLLVKSIDNKEMAYNARDIASIREASDKEWNDWMTRLELIKSENSKSEAKLKDLMANDTNNNQSEGGEQK